MEGWGGLGGIWDANRRDTDSGCIVLRHSSFCAAGPELYRAYVKPGHGFRSVSTGFVFDVHVDLLADDRPDGLRTDRIDHLHDAGVDAFRDGSC